MKLTKTLLSAIFVGITVQGSVSCTKDKTMSIKKTEKSKAKANVPAMCLACGMG